MDSASWPLPRLRLRTRDLLLRPTTEADLSAVAGTLSGEVSGDPRLPRFEALDQRTRAEVAAFQSYWQSVGNWSVDNWRLDFVVELGDRIIGVQSLEGEDFPVLRTVDSASHLAPDARGHGWGKQARRAVLAFAFGHLGAEYAITSAWHHNGPSLGVSRSLGYRPNGSVVTGPTRGRARTPSCTCGCPAVSGRPPDRRGRWRSAGSRAALRSSACSCGRPGRDSRKRAVTGFRPEEEPVTRSHSAR